MHELSIASSIVELSVEEALKAEASVITRVEVEIGTLAGIETGALLFAWDSATAGTMAAHSTLVIHPIAARAECLDCGKAFPTVNIYTECPQCKSFRSRITQGQELRISALIVD